MRLHRFITNIAWSDDTRIVIDEPRVVHQVLRVLRLEPGEQLLVVSPQGHEIRGTISPDSKKSVLAIDVLERLESQALDMPTVHLYCAILKKENFEWVVQKATEVGVATITPLITHRTVKQGLSLERMQLIALEAAEQSGRITVPVIGELKPLHDALVLAQGLRCWADIGDMAAIKINNVDRVADYSLFIGPEGGWSLEEQAVATESGCLQVSLGGRTLRAETAAIVGVYALVSR